ncbi:MAG TPA: hypothetical protein VLC46_18815 [Thermoanaerobaculia bacterium]|jgi:hypothetical protein|nr:hypothetical protein [Thermoanaerobaculia bacterium]
MKPVTALLCGFVLLGTVTLTAAVTPARLSFETSAVVGSGFTPGRQVVLFGSAYPPQPYSRRLLSYLKVFTADKQGSFRWEAPEPIAQRSVWFAIGSVPADQVVAVPGNAAPPKASLPPPVLLVGRDAGADALSISEYMTDVLVVRPDDTVWFGAAIRHGTSDLNRGLPGVNNFSTRTLMAKGAANGAGNGPAPTLDHLTPSDVVVVVDPVSLRFYAGRLSVN